MKSALIALVFLVCFQASASAADADPRTPVRNAIAQLFEKPNYSWTSEQKYQSPKTEPTSIEGQTQKNGYAYFTVVTGKSTVEVAFKGDKGAIRLDTEWESADELKGDRAQVGRRLKGFQRPVDEALSLLGRTASIKAENETTFYGPLTEAGAKSFISKRSRDAEPRDAKGWVRFWVGKDGALTKYQFNLQGKIIAGQNLQEVAIDLTTTVEIKNVGSTKVEVPEVAKKKLS